MCEAAVLSASKFVSSESPLNTTSVWSTKAVGFFNLVRVEIIKILVKKEHRPQAKQSPLSKLYLSFEISITFPWWCLGNRTLLQMLLRKQYFPIFWFIFLCTPSSRRLFCLCSDFWNFQYHRKFYWTRLVTNVLFCTSKVTELLACNICVLGTCHTNTKLMIGIWDL